jgi:transposase
MDPSYSSLATKPRRYVEDPRKQAKVDGDYDQTSFDSPENPITLPSSRNRRSSVRRKWGAGVASRELGLVEQTLRNWVKAANTGKLNAAGVKPVTPERMELSRLRAENARLKMHVEIPKKATAYFAKDAL